MDSIFEIVQCKREIKIFNNALFSKSCLQNSPNNMSLSNQPGTPRDDGEMGGNFLNPFQSESVSIPLTTLLYPEFTSEAFLLE